MEHISNVLSPFNHAHTKVDSLGLKVMDKRADMDEVEHVEKNEMPWGENLDFDFGFEEVD
jgi:hypothetical protein